MLIAAALEVSTTILVGASFASISSSGFMPPEFISKYLSANPALILFCTLAIFIAVKNLYLYAFQIYTSTFIYQTQSILSANLLNIYINLPYIKLTSNHRTSYITNILNEVTLFTEYIINNILAISTEIIIVTSLLITLFYFEPIVASSSIIFIASFGYFYMLLTKDSASKYAKNRQISENLTLKTLEQVFNGIREIKIYRQENEAQRQFNLTCEDLKKTLVGQFSLSIRPKYALESCAVFALFLIVLYTQNDSQSFGPAGTLGIFVATAYRILPSANRIIASMTGIRFALPTLDIFVRDLNPNTRTQETKNADVHHNFQSLEIVNGSIYFKDKHSPVLSALNLQLNSKEWVLIVGKSGAGKSTLVDVLSGLTELSNGTLKINGIQTSENSARSNLVSYVSQSTYIFDDSIYYNVTLNRNAISNDVRFYDAMECSCAAEFISPDNYHEEVFANSALSLSGGQKQRIGIARALYNAKSILILDEATSALDKATEIKVYENIKLKYKDMLIIAISHENTIDRFADSIYKIENGTLVKLR